MQGASIRPMCPRRIALLPARTAKHHEKFPPIEKYFADKLAVP